MKFRPGTWIKSTDCKVLRLVEPRGQIKNWLKFWRKCVSSRAVRRRRRHFADAAAADRNWSARRRRRPNVGVAPAPFSWRVHVMLYTSYMLLAICNVVYNKACTLTETTTRACFAIALDTQTKHGGVKAKVFSWTVLWKWKLMLKVSYGTSLVIGSIKRMV